MKKIWKLRKNAEAVSPVIATILMVAITVVLAAVLYVMVMGFSGGGASTPTASWSQTKTAAGNYSFSLLSISKNDVLYTDVNVVVTPVRSGGNTPAITPALIGATHLGAGDSFYVNSMTNGVPYTITVRYTPSGRSISTIALTPT